MSKPKLFISYCWSNSDHTASASVTPKALTATATAQHKTYDANNIASGTTLFLSGFVNTETTTATVVNATFNTKNVGNANTVTVNSLIHSDGANGGLVSNYSLSAGQTASASIMPLVLSIAPQSMPTVQPSKGNTTAQSNSESEEEEETDEI